MPDETPRMPDILLAALISSLIEKREKIRLSFCHYPAHLPGECGETG